MIVSYLGKPRSGMSYYRLEDMQRAARRRNVVCLTIGTLSWDIVMGLDVPPLPAPEFLTGAALQVALEQFHEQNEVCFEPGRGLFYRPWPADRTGADRATARTAPDRIGGRLLPKKGTALGIPAVNADKSAQKIGRKKSYNEYSLELFGNS